MKDDQRFCPDCGSENVEPDFRRTNVLGEMIFNQNKWVCNECGYTGIMPSGDPEDYEIEDEETGEQKEEHQKIEFEEKNHDNIDKEAGKAYFKYFLYILLPLTILYILYLRVI